MKTLIFLSILFSVIALPALAELTPEDLDMIREIVDIETDIIGDKLNFILALLFLVAALLIIGIYLPNIANMYETNKEYQYKKLENRIQTLEQETDKETQ